MENEIIEALNNIAKHNWFDYITLIISILALISSAVFTYFNIKYVNKNTNKQIENQNKETYRPRLRLKSIKNVKRDSTKRYLYAHSREFREDKEHIFLFFEIELENIGYGIANDLSFYMLNSGKKCLGAQLKEKTINQTLNSTIEIPKDNTERIRVGINFNKELFNTKKDDFEEEDAVLLICNYKDLNNNNYKILIGCILKRYEGMKVEYFSDDNIEFSTDVNYDSYYYQEDTKCYNGMIGMKEYSDNYKEIIEDISKE